MKSRVDINIRILRLEYENEQLREKQLKTNNRTIIKSSQEKREILSSKIKLLKWVLDK